MSRQVMLASPKKNLDDLERRIKSLPSEIAAVLLLYLNELQDPSVLFGDEKHERRLELLVLKFELFLQEKFPTPLPT